MRGAAGTGSGRMRRVVRLVGAAVVAAVVSGASGDPAADVGFPWGWTMVAAVAAAGIAATVAAVRRTRSLDGGAPGTAAVYGRATALIDGGRAALVRAPAEVPAASWRRLDDDAGDVLGALH